MFKHTLAILLCLLVAGWPEAALAKKKRARKAPPAPPVQIVPASIPDSPEEINVIAKGAILIDGASGETLWEKEGNARLYPASATKILTALLVIEAGKLDDLLTVEESDTQVEPTCIYFKPGEQFTRRELLYILLMRSANDVARALARDNAGSVEAFAEKMTRRAHQLGALESQFRNPHGLHDPEHYTTPHDLAMIARYAMQLPTFREIVGTREYDWSGGINGRRHLRNTNRLLRDFPGCTGMKTGYTVKAQHVLVSAAGRDQSEVICVVMHSDKMGKWTDSGLLLSYGLEKQAPAATAATSEAVVEEPQQHAKGTRTEAAPQ